MPDTDTLIRALVPRERSPDEQRVAATPETVEKMVSKGVAVCVERGAGLNAGFLDEAYEEAGATLADGTAPWSEADIVLKVSPLERGDGDDEASRLKQGAVVIGFLAPFDDLDTVGTLAERGVTSLSMELVPRITRAQSMDALSSQASIAGYKAVLLGAARLGRYFPLLMTAAGTIKPSRVVVMGGGVAGLQALATAKRLGAIVEVSDIRPAVKEQVESLGGKFIDLPDMESGEGTGGYAKEVTEDFLRRQREIVAERVAVSDVVITTAQVPGKQAPTLVTAGMVERMRPGAVIVDLAAPQGGNCELTRAGEEIVEHGVTIIGPTNLPATVPLDASTLYARNVLNLLELMLGDEGLRIDTEDEVVAGTLLTHGGEVINPIAAERVRELTGGASAASSPDHPAPEEAN